MIGIIVQLALSFLIIWFFQKGSLKVLGLFPSQKRLSDFLLFFLITAACCSLGFFMRIFFLQQQWQINPGLSVNLLFTGIWWNIKSVLFEELIFRGVLLYIFIKNMGALKGIIISAVAFGIYHWFSQGAIGNLTQMIILFFITGTMGLLLAYSYAKTFSLYIPCAIHFGWNLTQSVIFSEGSIGNQLFVQLKIIEAVNVSYFVFSCILIIPLISALLINFLLLRRQKQASGFPDK